MSIIGTTWLPSSSIVRMDVAMLHAEPLNAGDEPVAPCLLQDAGQFFGAFLRRSDNEAVS